MKDKIAKLIDVKSIMTLALTGGFIGLTCVGEITGEQFLTIFTMIVGFYFGTHPRRQVPVNRRRWSKSSPRRQGYGGSNHQPS